MSIYQTKSAGTCLFIGFGRAIYCVSARESILNRFGDYGIPFWFQLRFIDGEKFLPLLAWTPGGRQHRLGVLCAAQGKAGRSYARPSGTREAKQAGRNRPREKK
jgi:hypothetical protein